MLAAFDKYQAEYQADWALGQGMTMEQAVEYALEEVHYNQEK